MGAATAASAAPSQVIIIRHGEKPATGGDLLVPQGVCRADALATAFPAQFGAPTAIFAMNPNDEDGSMRPIQTVTPLARVLHLTIDHDYTRKQFSQLVSAVMSQNGLVLICWEHKAIPDLVSAFEDAGWSPGSATVPTKWSGSDFSSAWILDFNGAPSFSIVAENIPASELNGNCPLADVSSTPQ
jgi:hypothetical protein